MAHQPTDVRSAIEAIEKKGRLTPETVVRVAAKPKHPLHTSFEWDDTKAGHAHRIEQARKLIRSVRVRVTYKTDTILVPAYVRDPSVDEDEQGYVSVAQLRSEPDMAKASLRLEFARADQCLQRAQTLAKAFGNLKPHVDAAAKKVRSVRRRVERG